MRTHFIRKIAFLGVLVLQVLRLSASPQLTELLIINNDTIPIYQKFLPAKMVERLMRIASSNLDERSAIIASLQSPTYRGIWEFSDSSLYLVGFAPGSFGDVSLEVLFPNQYKNGKVLADWYNNTLIIPKGEVLRYDFFSCTYVEEEHLTFKNGHVISKERICNYKAVPNGISRLMTKSETVKVLFNSIVSVKTDWKRLNNKYDDYILEGEYYVTIGENGRVVSVEDSDFGQSPFTRL
ncbi:MAG: hypothetical protein IKS79_05790, partial [Bacteroidales bacterium]|nr:hypothetical protein [Bacteroidales bacterium]